ncbi:hypothetical protein V865_006230 [Kwoniella europaea PYCC6329]|uniref:RRM domain-containing protein n=1 Tax=Kwoniella europaea PYCC6329 TaxID=1423913 RepID=A0AAX4KPU5_9TREE
MSEEDFIPLSEGSGSKKDRKERVNTTVFVSSLPYTATTTDLLTHFSYLGPVRHGFVATDKDTGKSKGVGYVTYSLKEDADRAVQELNGSVFGGGNRKIRVSIAGERAPLKERKAAAFDQDSKFKAKPRVAAGEEKSGDPNAIRTLVLSGLPDGITKNVLWKKVRKIDGKAELVYPVPVEENEGESEAAKEDTANIIFPSHGEALKALPKLHGHTYKGSLLSCVLKKRLEKLSARGEGKSQSHAGRLIIRNLAWDTTIQDLRATFLPYGPIHSIDLPTLPSKLPPSSDPSKPPPPPRARGFAFVWFLTRKDAEKAIEGVNGKVLKTKLGKEGREVAVDFALSKEKWEEARKVDGAEAKEGGDSAGSGSESGSEEGSGSEEDSDDDESGSEGDEDEESGEDEAEDDEDVTMSEAGSDEDEEEEEEPVKPALPSVDVGSTLFIRNLPFEATEQELNTLFRSFGPLRYARITIDKSTGRSRGTGFVCFWKVEHADEAIQEAEKVARETGANAMPLGGGAKNPFALPSVLTADPSSSLASRLVLHGRTLEVSRAVTREQAGLMKEDSERARNAGDKRNTYLMREGVIFPNSPAAASLPEAEVEKRQASFNARKTLLRSNPSLYISKTRLSIRQLPLFATDRTLKRLAIYAVREFDAEVSKEEREGLSRTEEMDETLSAALEARKSSKKGKGKERETAVIQSKIVRQTEKVDPLSGQGRSKGYGFLEMRSHKDALKVLRFANNNSQVGKLMWDWWKEELKDLKDKTEQQLKSAREGKTSKGGESVDELEGRLKRIEQRLSEGDDRSEGGMRGGKTLLIEFSIENVQVVRRRVEKITSHRDEPREPRNKDRNGKREFGVGEKRKSGVIAAEDSDDEGGNASTPKNKKAKFDKKRDGKGAKKEFKAGKSERGPRVEQKEPKQGGAEDVNEKKGIEKLGNHLGSLIGRKRKQRRGGK